MPAGSRSLFPYQAQALRYCLAAPHAALFMEMRLGKTLVAIRACRELGYKTVLVVAPLSVLFSWAEELEKENLPFCFLRREKAKTGCWNLANYERLRVDRELVRFPFDTVILDESTRIKNPKAKTSQICVKNFRNVKKRFILTGYPAPEGPLNYVMQFLFLNGYFLGFQNYWGFRNQLFQTFDGYAWEPKKGIRERLKSAVHRDAFVLTRKQVGIGSRKVYEKRFVETNRAQRKILKEIEQNFSREGNQTQWKTVTHVWLSELAGGFSGGRLISDAKIKELLELFRSELKKQPTIIVFRFNREINAVWHALKKEGISQTWINGLVPPEERHRRRQKFQEGKVQVALLQVKCSKFGLDFSRASTCIFYSNSYSLEERVQSEDRIIHPLKREPLLYLDLVSRGTLDEDVVEALQEKKVEARFFMSFLFQRFQERIKCPDSFWR